MKRVPWGWLLVGGVLLLGWLAVRYLERQTQAADHVLRGMNAAKARDWETAEAEYSEAIRVAPPFSSDTAAAYAGRGGARNARDQYALALDDFNEAIRRDPANAPAFRGRAVALGQTGELERALADLDEAIRLDPANANAHYNRGVYHFRKGDYDGALEDFGEAINRDQRFAKAYLARSGVYAKQGDRARSEEDRQKAIEIDPSLDKQKEGSLDKQKEEVP